MTKKEQLQKELAAIEAAERLEKERKEEEARIASGEGEIFAEGILTKSLWWWGENSGSEISDGEYLTASEILGRADLKKDQKMVLIMEDGDYFWCDEGEGLDGPRLEEDHELVKLIKQVREKI